MAQVIEFDPSRDRGRRSRTRRAAGPQAAGLDRCRATTASGRTCRNKAKENGFCATHQPPAKPERIGLLQAETVRRVLDFAARRATGEYDIDPFGFDPELTERVFAPLIRPLHRSYFRVDWRGLEHVPDDGAVLFACNHAGSVPLDAMIFKFGLLDAHPSRRHVRLLAADLAFRMPFVGPIARKTGNTLACREDSLRLLQAGEPVAVFPEGYKGVGKGWRNRYKLQRFGRGGFVEIALEARVPIVPVAIVGSEETYPMLFDAKALARLFGLPYFPVTPTFPLLGPLGVIPLPSKWIIEFGEPVHTDAYPPDAKDDAMLQFELSDRIRDTIQQTLYRNLMLRTSTFW